MDCRADIVAKTGQRQVQRARAASCLRLGFEHFHLQPCLGKHDSHRQPIGSGANYASSSISVVLDWVTLFL